MDMTEQLGTFAIDVELEHQQDLFDLEDAMDQLVDSLVDEEVAPYTWDAISYLRDTLDRLQFRALITPFTIHHFAPNTHKAMEEPLVVEELDLE
jgi:hypothetical protein